MCCSIYILYIVTYIKIGRLQWAGHLIRIGIEDERPAKRAFQSNPGGNRLYGRPRARWDDNMTEDAGTIGVRMWTAKTKSKDDCNRILKKVRTFNGLLHQ